MKKVISFLILFMLISISSVSALTLYTTNTIENINMEVISSQLDNNIDSLINSQTGNYKTWLLSNKDNYQIVVIELYNSTNNYVSTYLTVSFLESANMLFSGNMLKVDYGAYNIKLAYDFDTQSWVFVTNNYINALTGSYQYYVYNTNSYLESLQASPGYEEYFIYEQEQTGKKIAEFYKTFPTITYQSNVNSNEYSKWKMQHTDFVEVYEYNDQSNDWSLRYKQYQGNWIGYQDLIDEIKIIASSQTISDGINIYGPDGNVSVNLNPDDDTYYKILTPPNNVSTIKNKVRFQIYVNMPMKKEFGLLNREYISTFAPRLYIKSNNIQNPNNINGYLPWIISPIYNSQRSLWWENNNQTNDYFKLVGHVTKNETFGRREIVYTIESDLAVGSNNYTFNLEPQFVLVSATGSHDVQNGDLISAAHSITRVQSVDANNDGIDDNTGESLTDTTPIGDDVLNPDDGYSWLDPDGSSSIDGDEISIGALEIFNGMMQFATAFTGSIGQIFGFLPPEILALIIFSLSTGVIIGIFKMLT